MMLGCGCSITSEATAQVTHLFNLTQVNENNRNGMRAGPNVLASTTKYQKCCILWRVQIQSLSYMKIHVSLSVLNELEKRYNMRGLSSILVIFATSLINSVCKRKILLYYDIKHLEFCHIYATLLCASLHNATKYEYH